MDAESWRQAKAVLAEALVCPPAERGAFVDAHCTDPELRREVHAFLAEYDEDFLESVRSVTGTLDSTGSSGSDAEQLPDIQAGDQIGPYVVVDQLGVGGMGRVFLGNDPRLHRKVALKCLSAAASATELRSRILHEARAAARITHPNIAIVHDVVEHESRPFLVMEYVEGENLAAVIKRERLSIERIVAMLRQLASALAAAHAKGIVHRDLKPANIQVTPDGSVKILDFGVAHAMSAAVTAAMVSVDPGLTVTLGTVSGQTLSDRRVMHPGTPAYMSPEQMFGRAIDQRSDIYSLGVIVYEMATGHRPYGTDDPLEVVLTLSKNFLKAGEAPTNLPSQINEVVTKMLAVKAEDRYQTAGELENALITLTAPSVEPPVTRTRRVAQSTVRALAVGAVVVAAVTFLGFMETFAFNLTLGRVAPFDRESPVAWLKYGTQALVGPLIITAGLLIVLTSLRFAGRVLALSQGIERLLTQTASKTMRVGERLGLTDPLVFSQAVSGLGIVLMVVLLWHFWPFISAYGTRDISTQSAERFLRLQPRGQGRLDAQLYRLAFTTLAFALGLALLRLRRLRLGHAVSHGNAGMAVVGAMFILAALLCQLPYRIVYKNDAPLLAVGAERCYQIGESADELLIHCPERVPPRNRVVKRADATVRQTGVSQNIFTSPDTAP